MTTSDYSIFSTLKGNRNIDPKNVAKIVESMKKKYLYTVILVNENIEIIDGQHRLEACKKLGLPINYEIIEGYGLQEVQMLNANVKNWGLVDYVEAFAKNGDSDYMYFLEFMGKYKFNFSMCCAILFNGATRTGDNIRSGKMPKIDKIKSNKIAESLLLFENVVKSWNKKSFVYTIINLYKLDNFDFNDLALRLSKCDLKEYATVEGYIAKIEEIYNKGRRNKINLRIKQKV